MARASSFRAAPPPGFHGLDPHLPVTMYRRHLPHWRQEGATYFVTFRQADSLPGDKLEELKALRREFEEKVSAGAMTDEEVKQGWEKVAEFSLERAEHWLDQGMGSCRLRRTPARKLLVDAIRFFHGERHQLGCYVVMSNHVHLVIRPLPGCDLESVLGSCKRQSARGINSLLKIEGALWQDENFDRIVRDSEHLWRCIQYIGRNPGKAGLREGEFERWIDPDWAAAGWDFLDQKK